MPQPMLIEQTPLETLVVSQIAAIRKRESDLQKRLGHLTGQATNNDPTVFAEELWRLQRCADRLNRMMDAMSGYPNSIV